MVRRFWAKVDVQAADQCWMWTAATSSGYGVLGRPGSGTGFEYAHRLALAITVGLPPAGSPLAVHSCDQPKCCNPGHLRWASAHANTADAVIRGRLKAHNRDKERCPRGHPYDGLSAGRRYCRACKRDATRRRRARPLTPSSPPHPGTLGLMQQRPTETGGPADAPTS